MYKKFRQNSAEKCNDAEAVKGKPQDMTINHKCPKKDRTRKQDPTIERRYVYRVLDIVTCHVK